MGTFERGRAGVLSRVQVHCARRGRMFLSSTRIRRREERKDAMRPVARLLSTPVIIILTISRVRHNISLNRRVEITTKEENISFIEGAFIRRQSVRGIMCRVFVPDSTTAACVPRC